MNKVNADLHIVGFKVYPDDDSTVEDAVFQEFSTELEWEIVGPGAETLLDEVAEWGIRIVDRTAATDAVALFDAALPDDLGRTEDDRRVFRSRLQRAGRIGDAGTILVEVSVLARDTRGHDLGQWRQVLREPTEHGQDWTEPTKAAEPVTENAARYVNLTFTREPGGPPIPRTLALVASSNYQLRLDIGAIDAASLVDRPTAFPADQLPASDEGHWLTVAANSSHFLVGAGPFLIFLPTTGSAWICTCEPSSPRHTCAEDARSPYLYVPVTAPPEKTQARLRIGLYHMATIVQAFAVTAAVQMVEVPAQPASAVCDYSLTPDLSDVADLPQRDISALADSDGATHRLIIAWPGAGGGGTVAASLSDSARDRLARSVREALLAIHVEKVQTGILTKRTELRNRYRDDNAVASPAQFRADLRTLAPLGRAVWDGLFGTVVTGGDVVLEIAKTAGLRMQVATPATSRFVFPWALVYDIPLGSNPAAYRDCPVLDGWDPAGDRPLFLPDGSCPKAAEHSLNTICPSGFWGFRHVIDQPVPAEGKRLATSAVASTRPTSRAVAGIGTSGLAAAAVQTHLTKVEASLNRRLITCHRTDDLHAALEDDDVVVAYFFCHGRWHIDATGATVTRLELDEGQVLGASDLQAWGQAWGHGHWPAGGPLVFVNGCHTADVTPDAVTDLVTGFARIGAAGVIGTETTVHQNVAAEAAERFWRAVAVDGSTVGQGLHALRHALLAKGNLLGLAYTAYCAAEFTLA